MVWGQESKEIDDLQTVYCPDCDSNYELSWSSDDGTLYVTCDCAETEDAQMFITRFLNEQDSSTLDKKDDKTYQ